ncbi:MAG: T9SS type A sorting domain-containing protein [Bacteroidetes bacterium]|nr:T9SS type A sorting domain-containing protein [Bacteroidota bacterium]MDA0904169.1 T9SS type A sorting domain-containing protein [Bacteroidota bacterium]MDA1242919.1 T9SS type A sorting domain-containing protein [Bacteroidota bacterium]
MKRLIFSCSFGLASVLSLAQAPYSTEIINQGYAPLEEYSTLELYLGWDDPEEMLPIPFDMVIWGDTCELLMTGNLGEMILGMGNNSHLLAPVLSDICDVAPADSTGQDASEIRHTVEGTAPDRVFKIEYHNVGFYSEVYGDSISTATQRATYQVWLHESGTITFHYGPSNITDPALVSDGFINGAGIIGNFDPNTYEGELLMAEGEADNPVFQEFTSVMAWYYGSSLGWGNTWPSEGTGYVFTPVETSWVASADDNLLVLEAFPNPASDVLHVTSSLSTTSSISWIDANGRTVAQDILMPGINTLNISHLAPGMYVIQSAGRAPLRVHVTR